MSISIISSIGVYYDLPSPSLPSFLNPTQLHIAIYFVFCCMILLISQCLSAQIVIVTDFLNNNYSAAYISSHLQFLPIPSFLSYKDPYVGHTIHDYICII